MCRFYVLLDGEVTQKRAEESIQQHLSPYKVQFKKTEWFSTFDGQSNTWGLSIRLAMTLTHISQGKNCVNICFQQGIRPHYPRRRCSPCPLREWRAGPQHRHGRCLQSCLASGRGC
jgi:hypothetical protein